jgi:hypothetical protein
LKAQEISEAIDYLIDNPEAQKKMSENGWEVIFVQLKLHKETRNF